MTNNSLPNRPIPEGAVVIPENAECAYKGDIFEVYRWPQRMFDGSTKMFEMVRRPDSVLVVPITDDGKLMVIREEQPGRMVREMRLPGGRMDVPGETALEAVQRECEEEIGMRFNEWYYLESMQPVRKIDWYVHIFIAKSLSERVPARHDSGEKIELLQTTYEEFIRQSDEAYKSQAFRECKTLDELFARARKV